jgi:DNA-binding response OmpR family regulator
MKKRILLADDDESVRRMVARVLESEGYDVLLAQTGREAFNRALSGSPDLILLDVNMPDQNGWEAFEWIERTRPLLPVIVITAKPNQHARATRTGIDALMEKPLDLALLLETIRNLLNESEQQRLKRLTDVNFSTAYLSPANEVSGGGNFF